MSLNIYFPAISLYNATSTFQVLLKKSMAETIWDNGRVLTELNLVYDVA